MLSNSLKILLISSITLLLIACDKQSSYIELIQNPNKLQSELYTCQTNQSTKNSKQCQQAEAVRTAIQLFEEVQQLQALRFPNAQQELMQYQELVEHAAKDKQLRNKMQAELAGVDQYYFSVSENYGKKVMEQEIKLSNLESRLQKLKNTNPESISLIINLEEQVSLARDTVQAMLALINVNTGGQG